MSTLKAQTRTQAREIAEKENLVAFFAEPNELLLDYDVPYDVAVMIHWYKNVQLTAQHNILTGKGGITITDSFWTKSKGGNAHLYMRLGRNYSHEERVIMHCLLGSDLAREAFNLIRYKASSKLEDSYCMALFETREQALLVEEWRIKVKIYNADQEMQAASL